MRFPADMGISPVTVSFLGGLGHNATHLHDEGLAELEDPDVFAKARDENRVLLTHDLGFGELVAASGARLPSVVVFRLRNMRPDRVNHYLGRIISDHHEALEQGAIASVTEGQIRVHLLPISR